jgi:hypothetical protein
VSRGVGAVQGDLEGRVARCLRDRRTIPPLRPSVPVLRGVAGNAGLAG